MKIIFVFKEHIESEYLGYLEKNVRAGDITLLKIFQNYQSDYNKEEFIFKLRKLSEEKTKGKNIYKK